MTMDPRTSRRPIELDYTTGEGATFNFFNTVYAWMATGLAVTALVAFMVSQNASALKTIYANGSLLTVAGLVAFAISIGVQSLGHRMNAALATLLFLVYAAILGVLLSGIFVIYSKGTIASAFFMTAGVFAGMSVYGFVTKRDLTGIGSMLVMCVWGLLLASIVNIFIASSALDWFITYAVLAVFIGITAYETQRLKAIAEQTSNDATLASRYAIIGSLRLYIAFINIFLSILRILGGKR